MTGVQTCALPIFRSGEFGIFKVAGIHNPADVLTKTLNRASLDGHLCRMNVAREEGRAESAPRVSATVDASLTATTCT